MADLIERKDALAKLIALRKDNAEYSCENDIMRGKDIAYENAMDIIARIPAVNRWISVEDALPEQSGVYLAYFTFKNGTHAIDITYINTGCHLGSITHWMPLPEPPEKE